MNSVLQLINQHGSCRAYKSDPLEKEVIQAILSASQKASTSSNLQAFSVIVITDAQKRTRLAALTGQEHVAQAPLFLTWCADLARLERVAELRGLKQNHDYVESFLTAVIDATIAAQNAALAAESIGLGMCYIGSLRNDPRQVIEMLQIPRLVFPVFGMTIGWPAKTPRLRPRLAQEAVVHWETYNPNQDAALLAYDREMAATGIYHQRQVQIPNRSGEMEDYGWLEHSARRISQPMRTFLRQILQEQGFPLE